MFKNLRIDKYFFKKLFPLAYFDLQNVQGQLYNEINKNVELHERIRLYEKAILDFSIAFEKLTKEKANETKTN